MGPVVLGYHQMVRREHSLTRSPPRPCCWRSRRGSCAPPRTSAAPTSSSKRHAGPYRLLVTVRPPHAIPGVADVEVLTTSDDVRDVRIVPLPLTGPGAQFAPVADRAERSAEDPRLFTGHLWLMSAGAWQVRVTVAGDRGEGTLSVPVPTLPQSTLAMNGGLRATLFALMLLLAAGFVGIVSAHGARSAAWRRRADRSPRALARPNRRCRRDARRRRRRVPGQHVVDARKRRVTRATFTSRSSPRPRVTADARLRLNLHDPGWIGSRRVDDFVLDHGHPMHLFVVSPALDRLWHLHPAEVATGAFEQRLPDMPAGQYEMFADLVHATGVSETVTGTLETAAITGAPLSGDDSAWPQPSLLPSPRSFGEAGSRASGERSSGCATTQPLVTEAPDDVDVSRRGCERANRRATSSFTWGCRVTRSSCGATWPCSRTCIRPAPRRWPR